MTSALNRPAVAILPSLDEPDTIAGVAAAVDAALDDEHALIVHADASTSPATNQAFRATMTRARTLSLTGLPAGKGGQVLAALRRLAPAGPVLLADTDTRNPQTATYRALLDQITGPASSISTRSGIALANYRRFWDEANLTNHLARPLIAAATGHDVPQPLAGDVALAPTAVAAVDPAYVALPAELARAVDGYGIDAFLLQVAATTGLPVTSVPLPLTKQHAPSFPHLPAIFAQAVPVLLRLAAVPSRCASLGMFHLADRSVPEQRLDAMLGTLAGLRPAQGRYDGRCWPEAVAECWYAVAEGTAATDAAGWLWPAYLDHVGAWLSAGRTASVAQRSSTVHATATDLLTLLAAPIGKD
jgi:glucosylglycerate synthase